MKTIRNLLAISIMLLAASCSSTYHAGSSSQDDVYYSSRDGNQNAKQQQPAAQPATPSTYSTENNNYQQENSTNTQQDNAVNTQQDNSNSNPSSQQNSDYYSNSNKTTDGNGNTYVTNNYYNDDYYDYAYTSRLRRFYTPAYGYNYYDPFYTNLYWYDYNPSSWGVSIYLGYHWWAPAYYYNDPFCYGGYYNYDPWYSPYYGGYSMGYMNGYSHGYYNGYMQGAYGYGNPYYYNSYDATSHYYGPRGSRSSNGRSDSRMSSSTFSGTDGRGSRSLGEKYQKAVADGRISNVPSFPSDGVRGTTDSKNNNGRTPESLNGRGNNIEQPVNQIKTQGGTKPLNTNPASIHSAGDTKNNNGNLGNEGVRPKGIISGKNEIGGPSKSTVPSYPEPVKNNDGRPTNNGGVINHNGISRPDPSKQPNIIQPAPRGNENTSPEITRPKQNENIPKPREEPVRNNPINQNINTEPTRPQQIETRPTDVPRNIESPRNQNQEPSKQNNEPRRPREMSNSRQESSPQQVIRSSENNNSTGTSGRSNNGNSNSSGRGRR